MAIFADDSQLWISYQPESKQNQDSAYESVQNCINDIKNWMLKKKLKMNDGTDRFLLIGIYILLHADLTKICLLKNSNLSSQEHQHNKKVLITCTINGIAYSLFYKQANWIIAIAFSMVRVPNSDLVKLQRSSFCF